jgi:hypothetical protein
MRGSSNTTAFLALWFSKMPYVRRFSARRGDIHVVARGCDVYAVGFEAFRNSDTPGRHAELLSSDCGNSDETSLQVQNKRKPLQRQPITVSALTMQKQARQSLQIDDSQTHSTRSADTNFERFTHRCKTPSWWRRARISNCSAARLRNDAKIASNSAEIVGVHGNRRMKDNPSSLGTSRFARTQ